MSLFRFSFAHDSPRNTFSLNGKWSIGPGTEERVADTPPGSIQVPSVVDCASPALAGREAEYYWYMCDVEIEDLPRNILLWLKIEQAQFGTSVWIDGTFTGSSTACYTSQEYRIDHLFGGGRHAVAIRVGGRNTLAPESPVGRDIERESYTPGIWGDVQLVGTGAPHIKNVQVIPSLERAEVIIRVALDAVPPGKEPISIRAMVSEWRSGAVFSEYTGSLDADEAEGTVEGTIPMKNCRPWSPDDPFLYVARVTAAVSGIVTDEVPVRFGMRDFRIVGNEFHLNGKRIFLKGGNIAFHRFLEDEERGLLPWDMEWVRRAFVDIPKLHYFNFFRFHLGHAYNRWYDLADEYGMLLQDEWQFWNATGSNAQIEREFRQWILDNANHPSIVIWDPLNESTDDSLVHDIVPRLRSLDPSRPWEAVDFREQHPYIYSLGMTVNMRRLGYTEAVTEFEKSTVPVVVNEFLWWWFDHEWQPTGLMKDVIERWMGRTYSQEQIVERQCYLAEELVGLFRRMRCAAIQPFVYLSNNRGPTAHWFEGPIAELKPKPVLQALRNAYSPFGVSIELWDRHFCPGEAISLPIHLFNDESAGSGGTLEVQILDGQGNVKTHDRLGVRVPPLGRVVVQKKLTIPREAGEFVLHTALFRSSDVPDATSRRKIFVLPDEAGLLPAARPIILLDPAEEMRSFLSQRSIPFQQFGDEPLQPTGLLFVNTFGLEQRQYNNQVERVTEFLEKGGVLVVQEPEFRAVEQKELRVSTRLTLRIERRHDTDKGGYDSYVFPEDYSHRLWHAIVPGHLQWFNGAPGGEIVSEHMVTPSLPFATLASCGLGLRIPAVMSVKHGDGVVIVSRIQIRGRLEKRRSSSDPFARRYDPAAVRYLFNLLSL